MLWKANNVTFAYVCIFIWFYYKQLNNKLRDLYHNYHQSVHSVCPCVCNNNDKTSFVYIGVGCEINYVSFGLSWTSIMACVTIIISVMETTGAWLIQRLIEHLITVYFYFIFCSLLLPYLNRIYFGCFVYILYMKIFVWTLIDYSCCWLVLC